MNTNKTLLCALLFITAGMTFVPQAAAETPTTDTSTALIACPAFDSGDTKGGIDFCGTFWGCDINAGVCYYGDCEVNTGLCYYGNCDINTYICFYGSCNINVGVCIYGGDCEVNAGFCAWGGNCTINLGVCYGNCAINIGYCYGFAECVNNAALAGLTSSEDDAGSGSAFQDGAAQCSFEGDNLHPQVSLTAD